MHVYPEGPWFKAVGNNNGILGGNTTADGTPLVDFLIVCAIPAPAGLRNGAREE